MTIQVVQITDTWEGNPLSLALKHLIPGFWDIWHQLGSPPAEQAPYRVVKRTLGYVIREYAPRLVTQPSLIDYSNSREVRKPASRDLPCQSMLRHGYEESSCEGACCLNVQFVGVLSCWWRGTAPYSRPLERSQVLRTMTGREGWVT